MLAGAEGLPLLRSSRPLAGLTQARFDHQLLDSPPDCLAHADALPGSSPFHLYYSGCRRGELVALNWNDINTEARTIRIDQAVSRSSEGLYLKDPKTKAGKRTIKLPEVCFDLLNQWKLEQMQICMALGSAWDGYRGRDYDKNPVFIQDDGKRMNVSTPTSKFKKIINAYNETVSDEKQLPMIRLHDLRHTNASYMIASGIDLETAAKRLGHSKPSFTLDVYGHALEENDERASETLEKIFAKAQ